MRKLLGVVVIGVIFSWVEGLGGLGRAAEIMNEATLTNKRWRTHEERNITDCFRGAKLRYESESAKMDVYGDKWKMWEENGGPLWTIEGGKLGTQIQIGKRVLHVAKGPYKIRRKCKGLWLTALTSECTAKGGEGEGDQTEGKGWCKLLAYGDGDGNLALRCNNTEHNEAFRKWSALVKDAASKQTDTTVTFKETDPKQSFLCALPGGTEPLDATKEMPNLTQVVDGKTYNLDDSDPREWKTDSYCYYSMLWLGQKVATYRCPIPEPQNCRDAIKRAFEEKKEGGFKAREAKVDKDSKLRELKLDSKKCKLETNSPTSAEAVLKKFQFTNGDEKENAGEIWCNSSGNTITCRFVPQCEVAITTEFVEKWKHAGIKSGVDYQGRENERNGLPTECKAKVPQTESESIKTFTLSGEEQIWCTLTDGNNQIKCRHLTQCEATVAGKFEGKWKEIVEKKKFEYKGGTPGSPNFPTQCKAKGNSDSETAKKFESTGSGNKEFWCVTSGNGGITCRQLSSCEVAIAGEFNQQAQKSVVDRKIDYNDGGNKQQSLPGNCNYKGDSGTETVKTFTPDDNNEKRIWCTYSESGQQIKCKSLSLCEATVAGEFPGQAQKIVQAGKFEYTDEKGEKADKLPETCTNGGILDTRGDANVKKFKSNEKQIWCVSSGSNGGITCRSLSPCEATVATKFQGTCPQCGMKEIGYQGGTKQKLPENCGPAPGEQSVSSGGNTTFKNTHPQKDLAERFTCKVDTAKISCTLLPPTCQEVVQKNFKGCEISAQKVTFNGQLNELENKGTKPGEECPLVDPFPKGEDCDNKKEVKFKITNGKNKNRDISCKFDQSQISCGLVNLTCAQTVEKAFGKTISHSSQNFQDLVAMDKDGGKIGDLNSKTCEPTNEKNESSKKTFKLTQENEEQEILCNNASSQISCSLLPPRCGIENYQQDGEKPLRCKEDKENITISGGKLEELTTCNNEGPKDNDELDKKCKITVKYNGIWGNKDYFCDNEDRDILGENVCTKMEKIPATSCNIGKPNFDNNQCKSDDGRILIPKGLLWSFLKEMKEIKDKCNKTDNNDKIEEKCSVKVDISGNESFMHCPEDEVKELQKKLENICKNELPSHLPLPPGKSEEEVILKFQSDEKTGKENDEPKVQKIKVERPDLPEPGLWGPEEGDFASLNSPLPFLLFTLF